MDTMRFADAPFYTAPDHDDVVARRLQGGEASTADFVLVGHSTLRDGAVIPMDAAEIGKVYVVTEGTLIVEQADATRHALRPLDSIGAPAAMIVITPPPRHAPATD